MPLFATMVVVCALNKEGTNAVCDIVTQDKYHQISQPICYGKLDRIRFKAAADLMKRLDTDELFPGSHNCFESVAHRDAVLNRITLAYKKAGITFTIINQDK
jgi:hypothetical protein